MRYINGIINLGVGLVAVVIGLFGLSNYFGGNQTSFDKYTKLETQGKTIIGDLDTAYTTIKIKGIEILSAKYTFQANGQEYKGIYYFDAPSDLNDTKIEVHYLEEDPSVNGVDVAEKIAEAKESLDSNFDLWLGLGITAFGIIMLYLGFRKFRPKREELANTQEEEQTWKG